MTQQTIPISSITFDVAVTVGDVQLIPRHEYDLAAIERYRRALIEGRPLPAVVVAEVGDARIPLDGRHRLRASLSAWGALNEALAATGAFHRGECP